VLAVGELGIGVVQIPLMLLPAPMNNAAEASATNATVTGRSSGRGITMPVRFVLGERAI
jgi:hypothetical protein